MPANLTRFLSLLALSAICCLAAPEAKTPTATLVLKDKTQLVGQILELKNGTYKIKTGALGEVTVKADQVASIQYAGAEKAPAPPPAPAAPAKPAAAAATADTTPPVLGESDRINALFGFDSILKAVMSDPDIMAKVQKLADDPEFASVLDDPAVRKAIEDGNFVALSRNSKIWGLLNNPTVKDIAKSVKDKSAEESTDDK